MRLIGLTFLLAGCGRSFPVGAYSLDLAKDGSLSVVRSDGKVLASGLRFDVGTGSATVEMTSGSYLFDAVTSTWTGATTGRGVGKDTLSFPLRGDGGDQVGTLTVTQPQSGFLSFQVAGTGNRVRWEAACTGDDHFVGLGQHAMDVDHVGEAFALWVSEPGIGKVDSETPPTDWYLTGTRHSSSYPDPFFVRPEPMGLLVDSAARIDVDLCTDDRWRLDVWAPEAHFLVIDGESPLEIVQRHALLTGPPPVPPTWALAPWNDAVGGADRVREVAATLREAGAPSSAIWTEDWKGAEQTAWGYHLTAEWTLDEELYPDAAGIDDELEAAGFKWLAYFSPFLVAGTQAYEEAAAFAIRDADEETYWFLGVTFEDTTVLDLTRDDARRWAAEKMAAVAAVGFDGWMADYAEWLPTDALLANADAEEAHNAYPLWWQDTNAQALAAADQGDDMLYFTRSGWTGTVARTKTAWAGDQRTSFDPDDGLPTVVPMSLGAGVSGIAWYGSDIAGYQSIGNAPSTKELWFRWCTLGAFSPIMRTHHGAFKDDNWQFDTDAETLEHYARYARVHASLYPYLRGLAYVANAEGTPLLLAPFLRYPDEDWGRIDAWLLGPSLLVAPVMEEGATARDVQLPAGVTWYDWWTGAVATSGTVAAGVDEIPVFAPAGAVVPVFPDPPDTLLDTSLAGVTTLRDADTARTIRVFAGAAGSFTESDATSYTTDGVATSSGTVTETLTSGTLSAGGLTLTVTGTTERTYTLEVWAP